MNYSIFTCEQITPKYITVHGATQDEQALNMGSKPVYPVGASLNYMPVGFDRYSDDENKRKVLLNDPNGKATEAEIKAAFPLIYDAKYNKLWTAAHNYEQKHISGVGLSILSLGVAQGKPKALAAAQWSQNLWMIYYQRKAAVTLSTEPDLDFTPAGEMPYSVPELSAEVWA